VLSDLNSEVVAFPSAPHDDVVDEALSSEEIELQRAISCISSSPISSD
jgi:phage terminase large subunit-like protein